MLSLEFSIILFAIALFLYFAVVRSGLSLALWVPTHRRDFERVATALNLQPGERLLEAGCGDARVSVYLGRRYPANQVIGYELSVVLFLCGWLRVKLAGLSNVSIRYGDVLRQDLSQYDAVYVYALTKTVNEKLLPKIKTELKSGTRLVSYAFAIADAGNVQATKSETATNLYVYTQPK